MFPGRMLDPNEVQNVFIEDQADWIDFSSYMASYAAGTADCFVHSLHTVSICRVLSVLFCQRCKFNEKKPQRY